MEIKIMAKSTITRERLEELASGQSGFNLRIATLEESQQLARMALAAMGSEPVAEVYQTPNVGICAALGPSIRMLCALEPGTKLYRHAQPAPAVPEVDADDNFYSWFGREWAENYQHNQYTTAAKQMLGVMAESAWKAGRRAAMLAAAPQSPGIEPATVPGKWIPVSEQMPEAGGDMIVFTDGIVMSGVSYAKKKGFYIQALEYDDDEPVDSVTHWMPLPAAPQEVKGE
ncbi:DUF551 domain-containing protein [Klebsiella variicola]|nr:DUF551 domain-containing protein [Klebsiella variicola]MBC4424317.1 DUF551 domain-containing protein [Klebsiella variicola]